MGNRDHRRHGVSEANGGSRCDDHDGDVTSGQFSTLRFPLHPRARGVVPIRLRSRGAAPSARGGFAAQQYPRCGPVDEANCAVLPSPE